MDPKAIAALALAKKAVADAGATIRYKKESSWWRLWAEVKRSPNVGITTTWRKTIWVPDDWDQLNPQIQAYILIHELVHIKQFKKLTWLGFLWVYLFPFPTLFCYGRYWLEARACEEEFKYRMQLFGEDFHELADQFAKDIAGPDYFWGWVFKTYTKKDMEKRLFKFL